MAEIKAKADKESSSSEVKYSFFAGRWQPLHKGHLWLINERLKDSMADYTIKSVTETKILDIFLN